MSACSEERNLEVSLEFLGATDGIVTGSANLVTITRCGVTRKILVDYGWFQGVDEYLNDERQLVGSDIDCILLTHSHLDHCGGIPLLFKTDGDMIPFSGIIYGSRETLRQAEHILRDSAKLNSRKLRGFKYGFEKVKASIVRDKEKAEREEAKSKDIAALDFAISSIEEEQEKIYFTLDDVEEAISHFYPLDFDINREPIKEVTLFEGIDAKFVPISHINGSTMIEVTAHLGCDKYTIVFTGDIGNEKTILYRKIDYPVNPDANAIVLESLHGVSAPVETLEESTLILKRILRKALRKQRTVIIPSFALDRSAGIIKILNDFMDEGIPLNCFIDSPLAELELSAYIESYLDDGSAWFNYEQGYPFKIQRFNFIESYQEHILATKYKGPNVILTSSCMGFGGRVVDYFAHHIQSNDSIFIFPGYLTEDCPSRALLECEKGEMIEINGSRYIKQCETVQLHGFSSHGYLPDKMRILNAYPNLQTIFLNHGDDGMDELQDELIKTQRSNVIIPELNSYYKLV